ncbi:hypothetical protein [Bartonella sp. HY761]|uniref:hypothetical protein n=1 Tax=Bartonella sp. HY761 TaxID=2979330 RepID=UPI0021FF8842|nr:hypothetical protein [Bartonella sp. HY761]UXN06819.1 hypothetical protein N6A79_02070 [Bartonella sp. HY761]
MARADKKRHSGTTRKPAAIDHEPLPKGSQNVPDAEPVAMAQLAAPKAQNNPTQDAPQKQPVQDSGNKAVPANEKIAAIGGKDNSTDKDDMTSKQNSTSNMTSTPDSGKKTGSGLLAGVAGGVIAIALAGALQFSGVIPPLSNHGQAVSTGTTVATALSDSMQKELSALKAELSKLKEQGQQQLSNASNAISAVDKNLIEKATKAADDARATANQAQQSLSDIRQSTSSFAAQFDGLKAEIASLKENLAQNIQATISADDPQIRSLEGKLNALDESLASFKNATEQRFNGIQSDLDKAKQLESAVSQNTANIAKSNATLDSLAVEVKKIPDPLAERAKSMTTLIAANALKSAVDRGGSFVSELATFESLAPKGLALDELKKYSTTGIASNAALSEEFSSVADAIAATENQVGSDANLGQKAWSYAKGFVAIRPVGNVEGDNAGAIAARMEVAIKEADYNRALSEWQKLPQSAKDISASFISKLKVRNDIDQLLAQLVNLTINPDAKTTPQAPAQPIPASLPHETAPNHGETQP